MKEKLLSLFCLLAAVVLAGCGAAPITMPQETAAPDSSETADTDAKAAFRAHGHRADGYKQVGARKRKSVSAHAAKAGRRYGNARQNRVRAGKCKRSAVKQALVKQKIPLDIGIKWDLLLCF